MKRKDSYFESGIVLIGMEGDSVSNLRLGRLVGLARNCWDTHGHMVMIQTIPTAEELNDKDRPAWYGPKNIGIISREKIIRKLTAQEIFDFLFEQATTSAKR